MKAEKTGITLYGKYSNEVEYIYRGHKYMVEYPVGMTYWCTAPKVQHELAQEKIDRMIEDRNKPHNPDNDAEKGFEMFFNYLETGEWSD